MNACRARRGATTSSLASSLPNLTQGSSLASAKESTALRRRSPSCLTTPAGETGTQGLNKNATTCALVYAIVEIDPDRALDKTTCPSGTSFTVTTRCTMPQACAHYGAAGSPEASPGPAPSRPIICTNAPRPAAGDSLEARASAHQ